MSTTAHHPWRAMLRQRCPRCQQGRIFRGSVTMNAVCPVCHLSFEREPGYFLGAMYISYGLSFGVLGLFTLLGHLIWPQTDLGWIVLGASVLYLPLVPVVFRYSRVLWMYWDRWAWPDADRGDPPVR